MKILFVGSNPSTSSKTTEAFAEDTVSGRNLRSWIDGVEGELYFDNISSKKTKENRPLLPKEISRASKMLAERIAQVSPDRVVALGKSAAAALEKLEIEFVEMPHPSGLNRQLNDKQFMADKIEELKKYCEEG